MHQVLYCLLVGVFGFCTVISIDIGAHAASRGLNVELRASNVKDAPVTETIKLYGASHALVIGNDMYNGAWPRLSNAVKDARLVADALIDKGFDVTLKTNLKSRDLVEAFEEFFFELGRDPEARLFLWYAGHGYSERGEGYLVPIDAPDPSDTSDFLRSSLSLRRMGEFVRGADARHILSVFDSCFAGTIFNVGRAKPPPTITRATTRLVRQFLTSGDAGQEVSDDGVFRKLFLRAIGSESDADANGDGFVAASELGLFITSEITNYSNGSQTPRNGKLNDPELNQGDFIFKLSSIAPMPTVAKVTANQTTSQAQRFDSREHDLPFWESVKDSKDPEMFKAYLQEFPTGSFRRLAHIKREALLKKRKPVQTASMNRKRLKIALEPIESTYVALRNANVRSMPVSNADRIVTLESGSEIYVSGKVLAKDWFAVERNGKFLGYVFSKLLQNKAEFDTVRMEKARAEAEISALKKRQLEKEQRDYKNERKRIEDVRIKAESQLAAKREREREQLLKRTEEARLKLEAALALAKREVESEARLAKNNRRSQLSSLTTPKRKITISDGSTIWRGSEWVEKHGDSEYKIKFNAVGNRYTFEIKHPNIMLLPCSGTIHPNGDLSTTICNAGHGNNDREISGSIFQIEIENHGTINFDKLNHMLRRENFNVPEFYMNLKDDLDQSAFDQEMNS
jgi:uncharacterized caspase-like protein